MLQRKKFEHLKFGFDRELNLTKTKITLITQDICSSQSTISNKMDSVILELYDLISKDHELKHIYTKLDYMHTEIFLIKALNESVFRHTQNMLDEIVEMIESFIKCQTEIIKRPTEPLLEYKSVLFVTKSRST